MAAWISLIQIFLLVSLNTVASQNCIPAPKGMHITEVAYLSPIVVKAKVTKTGSENHTAEVTEVFATHAGKLLVGSVITFGPVKKSKECPKIRKNKENILFLEEADATDTSFYRIKYNPVSKLSQLKKLKKSVLCAGCVKPPKFKKDTIEESVRENRKFVFNCKVSGSPKPMVIFLKDGAVLPKKSKGMKITIKKRGGGGKIKINKIKKQHQGVYTCQATNVAGDANLTYTLTVLKDDCTPCGPEHDGYCMNGRCCVVPVVNQVSCRCTKGYTGKRCGRQDVHISEVSNVEGNSSNVIEAQYHQQTIAIMGVCIALLLVIIICYVVYCRFKKSRSKIRKEILNGHLQRAPQSPPAMTITGGRNEGIIGGNSGHSGIHMTDYRSTDFSEGSQQPRAFTQRPQTYDDVILPGPGSDGQPQRRPQSTFRNDEEESPKQGIDGRESNSKRQRLKGIAIGQPGIPHSSTSEVTPKMSRQVEKIKSDAHSMTSSTSSIASHDLKKPVLPIDERVARLARSEVYIPPSYQQQDEMDGEELNEDTINETSPLNQHMPEAHPDQDTTRDRMPSSVSGGSAGGSTQHVVTTFGTDGKIEEQKLGREDDELQGVTPHSPNLSPQGSYQRSPRSDIYIPHEIRSPTHSSPGQGDLNGNRKGIQDPRFMYPNKNKGGNSYPYYEPNQEHPGSPKNSHNDSDDIFSGMEIPDTSLGLYSPNSPMNRNQHNFQQPSSPRQYQTSPEMSMGVPYRHAPITVASARHHHLPLLTKEKPENSSMNPENSLLAGSTVSLSSSSNSSIHSERHRDSHKIEV